MFLIKIKYGLILSIILFVIGITGILIRRNIFFIFMCLEIILNSIALAFIVAGSAWNQSESQIIFIIIMTIAACEASIGLAFIIKFYRSFKTFDINIISRMKG
ncbi:NADH-quinone oxidoreductase subunit K [Candidatus Johnevansia muelleri]|uniref:NADH-quinone oxidoreductase subunit K n=1 Tax=Candidatus Johnevansia muelleri TaxID=1495769 RepID=A0A078KET6_9GAMM|nr:NADH-quinone oxidoreductase subunit K [Candidatus Evansia muelleri]